MTGLICIVCPNSCNLSIDDKLNVTGNLCARGVNYALEELQNPVRTVTSTVRISGSMLRRCPVRTRFPIPKELIPDAMRLLDAADIAAPVEEGHIVVSDICGTGIPFVTTRSITAT